MKINRFRLNEITFKRIILGLFRRFKKIPNLISWIFLNKGRVNKKKLKQFENIHKGKTCILLCNGPSLKQTNFKLIQGQITFGLNRIYLLFEEMGFSTNYLTCINNLVLEQFAEEIDNLKLTKFINWEKRNLFTSESTNFIYDTFFGPNFSKDISVSLKPSATVTYAALQIIYYMGFNRVLIIGMDHSFNYTGNVNETQKVEKKDINHFAENYFPKGSKWETPDLESSEYYYKIAKDIYEENGREIIDCTPNGKCDIFQKGILEEELSKIE